MSEYIIIYTMLAAVGVGIIELAEAIGIGAGAAETVAGTAAGVELTTGAAGAAAGAAEGGAAGAAALESAPLIFSEGLDVAPGIYGSMGEGTPLLTVGTDTVEESAVNTAARSGLSSTAKRVGAGLLGVGVAAAGTAEGLNAYRKMADSTKEGVDEAQEIGGDILNADPKEAATDAISDVKDAGQDFVRGVGDDIDAITDDAGNVVGEVTSDLGALFPNPNPRTRPNVDDGYGEADYNGLGGDSKKDFLHGMTPSGNEITDDDDYARAHRHNNRAHEHNVTHEVKGAASPETDYSSLGTKQVGDRPDAPSYSGKDNYAEQVFARCLKIIGDELVFYLSADDKMASVVHSTSPMAMQAKQYILGRKNGSIAQSRYNRMVLPGAMRGETEFISKPAVIPFVAVSLVAYMSLIGNKDNTSPVGLSTTFRHIMKHVMNLPQNVVNYGIEVLSSLPPSFTRALISNASQPTGVSDEERNQIQRWIEQSVQNYRSAFGGRRLYHDVKELEQVGVDIWSLFIELETPRVLNMLAKEVSSVDRMLFQDGILQSLIALSSVAMDEEANGTSPSVLILNDMMKAPNQRAHNFVKGNASVGLYRVGRASYTVAVSNSPIGSATDSMQVTTQLLMEAQARAQIESGGLGDGLVKLIATGNGNQTTRALGQLFLSAQVEAF
jgi:hypothetical protein